jgi:hypothetical protein
MPNTITKPTRTMNEIIPALMYLSTVNLVSMKQDWYTVDKPCLSFVLSKNESFLPFQMATQGLNSLKTPGKG